MIHQWFYEKLWHFHIKPKIQESWISRAEFHEQSFWSGFFLLSAEVLFHFSRILYSSASTSKLPTCQHSQHIFALGFQGSLLVTCCTNASRLKVLAPYLTLTHDSSQKEIAMPNTDLHPHLSVKINIKISSKPNSKDSKMLGEYKHIIYAKAEKHCYCRTTSQANTSSPVTALIQGLLAYSF